MRNLLVFLPLAGVVITAIVVLTIGSAQSYVITDYDGDGCSDFRELGHRPSQGGQRDPTNHWDFYDIVGWNSGLPDGKVDLMDLVSVGFRVGATQGSDLYESRPAADRARSGQDVLDIANIGPPDGVIDMTDFWAAAVQFQTECLGEGNLPEALKLAGVESPEDFKTLIEVELEPVLQQIESAGGAGGDGVAGGQTLGDYEVVCTFPDGGLMVIPVSMPEPTEEAPPLVDDGESEEEEVDNGSTC